jgi:hypothetical protein
MAWAKFDAFRTHLPDSLDEEAVSQFHAIVSLLEEASSEGLAGFRIPESEMKHRVISIRPAAYLQREFRIAKVRLSNRFLQIPPPGRGCATLGTEAESSAPADSQKCHGDGSAH